MVAVYTVNGYKVYTVYYGVVIASCNLFCGIALYGILINKITEYIAERVSSAERTVKISVVIAYRR